VVAVDFVEVVYGLEVPVVSDDLGTVLQSF
jgi:hypothetical protein